MSCRKKNLELPYSRDFWTISHLGTEESQQIIW